MIQASHFDAGFANSLVGIANLWFHTHFPRALSLGLELDALGGPERMRFMTQSYLVSLFMNCPPNVGIQCPNSAEIANFTEAVNKGYLTWHAFPHNAELGTADASLIDFGVQMTHDLDAMFRVRNKTVVSQRDVPGAPRSAMHAFRQKGVRTFSVGVNTASTAPLLPRAFNWQDPNTGETMLTMYHPFGYGGFGVNDAIILPGMSEIGILAWKGDNQGPADNVAEIKGWWEEVGKEFPGAEIVCSDFEQFLDAVEAANVTTLLPTITSEVGDTWVYGIPTDPVKRAYDHVAMDHRTACIADGSCAAAAGGGAGGPGASMSALYNFSRLLIKVPEHTDGRDVKTFLHDATNWTNVQFQAALAANLSNYNLMVSSWDEQRDFSVFHPVRALLQEWLPASERNAEASALATAILDDFVLIDGGAAARAAGLPVPSLEEVRAGAALAAKQDGNAGAAKRAMWAESRLQAESVSPQNMPGYSSTTCSGGSSQALGPYTVTWNTTTGAIIGLDRPGQNAWATPDRPALVAEYLVYSAEDYAQFISNYSSEHPPPSYLPLDFGKPNVTSQHIRATSSLRSVTCTSSTIQLQLTLDRDAATLQPLPAPLDLHAQYGAPSVIVLTIGAPAGCSASSPAKDVCPLAVSVHLVSKTATRMPEALFLRFNPEPLAPDPSQLGSQWRFTAVNAPDSTDPADVQLGGNRYMHAVQGPLSLRRVAGQQSDGFCVNLIDARVASFGRPDGLPTPIQSDIYNSLDLYGAGVYLSGNLWGTNYPQWVPIHGQPLTISYRMEIGTAMPFAC